MTLKATKLNLKKGQQRSPRKSVDPNTFRLLVQRSATELHVIKSDGVL